MKNKKLDLDKVAGGQNIVTAKDNSNSTWKSTVDSFNNINNATSQSAALAAYKEFQANDKTNEARKREDSKNHFTGSTI